MHRKDSLCLSPLCLSPWNGPEEVALLGRHMFKRELGVSRLLDLDHERHSSFGAAKRERLTCVLERDRVYVLAVAIRTPLDHATTKLRFLVGIMKINDGERDTRVTPSVLRLK